MHPTSFLQISTWTPPPPCVPSALISDHHNLVLHTPPSCPYPSPFTSSSSQSSTVFTLSPSELVLGPPNLLGRLRAAGSLPTVLHTLLFLFTSLGSLTLLPFLIPGQQTQASTSELGIVWGPQPAPACHHLYSSGGRSSSPRPLVVSDW